jgi:hypothetical protein
MQNVDIQLDDYNNKSKEYSSILIDLKKLKNRLKKIQLDSEIVYEF